MRTPDRSESPPNPLTLTPLPIPQNMEVEPKHGIVVCHSPRRAGVFIGRQWRCCGRKWCAGGTSGRPAGLPRGQWATILGHTDSTALDSLQPTSVNMCAKRGVKKRQYPAGWPHFGPVRVPLCAASSPHVV
jgi:hypothetical protein